MDRNSGNARITFILLHFNILKLDRSQNKRLSQVWDFGFVVCELQIEMKNKVALKLSPNNLLSRTLETKLFVRKIFEFNFRQDVVLIILILIVISRVVSWFI